MRNVKHGVGTWFVLGCAMCTAGWLIGGCGGSNGDAFVDVDSGTPDGGDDSSGDDTADPVPVCGNGTKEGVEECDDGNKVDGDGCQADCTLLCKPGDPLRGDPKCDDGNPCNGTEKCNAKFTCDKGTALKDGDACGTGKTCKGGDCIVDSCGDGIVTAPEECDDGNVTNGDGCDSCKFTCLASDKTRDCSAGASCVTGSTCDPTKHVCSAGSPAADGTACTGGTCKGGTCTPAACGDGVVQAGESCDFGAGNGAGTGCEIDCKFSCQKTPTDTCLDTNACNGIEVCANVTVGTGTGQKCNAGTPATDGTVCTGGTCKGGVCAPTTCGNGTVDAGEDCDFGAGNGPGTGCENSCKFSCTKSPDSCPDANLCNGTETCATVTVGGKTGQKCNAGTPLAACAACGTGVCVGGACKSSVCGDSCVDATKGETCDPPAASTCSATCTKIVAAVCGNGTRETGEQCDDGGTANLDGCDSTCKFEQDHRANSVKMQMGSGATDTFCTVNALGKAISSAASGQVQKPIDDGVAAGTMNVMFNFGGLDDLSGVSDSAIVLGGLNGTLSPGGTGYTGTNDLDWWYVADALSIDASRKPTATLAGSITARTLNAGPGNMTLNVVLSGAAVPLALSSTRIRATTTTANVPKTSTGAPPGHLAAEHLDPALTSFPTMSNGELCGNVSAYSLSKIPAPSAVLAGGSTACKEGYTAANSLLDVIVGGCNVTIFITVTAISKTQPDQSDPTAPVAGAGPKYTLVPGAGKAVTSCTDKTGATVPLDTCLKSAAYSAFFKFTTDRVIIK